MSSRLIGIAHANFQYTVVLTNAYWVLLGIPWFILQKSRRGPSFPPGTHWWSIGWIQIFKAVREFRRLPHTFIFLAAFFLLADGLNTNGTLVGIVQNQRIQFSFLQSTYLTLVSAITSIFSCYAFWYIQRYKKISTKKMFVVTNVVTVFIPLWGMIGIWTKKFGFHNIWEFWAYNAVYGLGQAPYWYVSLPTAGRVPLLMRTCPQGVLSDHDVGAREAISRLLRAALTTSRLPPDSKGCFSVYSDSPTEHRVSLAPMSFRPSLPVLETSGKALRFFSPSALLQPLSYSSSSTLRRAEPMRSLTLLKSVDRRQRSELCRRFFPRIKPT